MEKFGINLQGEKSLGLVNVASGRLGLGDLTFWNLASIILKKAEDRDSERLRGLGVSSESRSGRRHKLDLGVPPGDLKRQSGRNFHEGFLFLTTS